MGSTSQDAGSALVSQIGLVSNGDWLLDTYSSGHNSGLLNIHKNYKDSSLALDGIAKEFNISKFYLSRFFKENTGEKYIDYISNLRIQEAKRLLKEENLSIRDVIQNVGYFDMASFNKKFKRAVGISAREYKLLCNQDAK